MVGGRRPLSAPGAQGEVGNNIERNSMLGYYRALFSTNTPVDFVHIDEIGRKPYKLIILPYPLMISQRAAQTLVDFVRGGGALVSEARLGWNDERGRAKDVIPGFGLNEVCGCRETAIQTTPSGKVDVDVGFKGFVYQESLDGNAIAHFADGSNAIVTNNFGKGRMMTIGTFLGTAYEADRDEKLGNFIRGLLDWAGVKRGPEAPVEIRTLGDVTFAFNHGDAPVDVRLAGVDLETGVEMDHKVVQSGDVWVLRRR